MLNSPLILIDEESLSYYCTNCHTHTQNDNHTCEGYNFQLNEIVRAAEQGQILIDKYGIIYPPKK